MNSSGASSGATKMVEALVALASCSGASHSSDYIAVIIFKRLAGCHPRYDTTLQCPHPNSSDTTLQCPHPNSSNTTLLFPHPNSSGTTLQCSHPNSRLIPKNKYQLIHPRSRHEYFTQNHSWWLEKNYCNIQVIERNRFPTSLRLKQL